MGTMEVTDAERAALEAHRAEGDAPKGRGHPPAYDESQRKWGEAPPPNAPTVQRIADPAEWVGKQMRNLEAVGETNYREGITRPRKDPIQAGIAAQPAYEAKMRDQAVLRRRVAGLQRTNMDEWARMCEEVGATNLVRGVQARRFKVERAVSSLHGKLTQHLQRIDAMPNATDADRERRMIENRRGLMAMKGTI